MRLGLRYQHQHIAVDVQRAGDSFRVTHGETQTTADVTFVDDQTLLLDIQGQRHRAVVARDGSSLHVAVGRQTFRFTEEKGEDGLQPFVSVASPEIVAPMPGKVVRVLVQPGERVASGDTLFVLEAMKMENRLVAEAPGIVQKVEVSAGDLVDSGQVLAVLAYTTLVDQE